MAISYAIVIGPNGFGFGDGTIPPILITVAPPLNPSEPFFAYSFE